MVADKLNNTRYLSHFRSIHRGQYFTEMKTTTVRKLLPEAWGFICPVHTPDGAPCGLLNHITLSCAPLAFEEMDMKESFNEFKALCTKLGMNPVQTDFNLVSPASHLPVMLDGLLLGYVDPELAPTFANALRAIKVKKEMVEVVPMTLEIAYLAPGRHSKLEKPKEMEGTREKNYYFPGIFLSAQVSRFVRPV
jgi:DNA-directed RNA polymerase I subunit RPA2